MDRKKLNKIFERRLKEIESEPVEVRFPIKKKFDLNKEVNDAINELNIITDFSFIISNLTDGEYTKKDLIKLQGFLSRITMAKIILERIRSKI